MSERISDKDYSLLERFVKMVLAQHHDDKLGTVDAVESIMHPLTALIDGGIAAQEGFPYMKLKLSKWHNEAAKQN